MPAAGDDDFGGARHGESTGPDASGPVAFSVDLGAHEMTRRALVMDALGPDWDPVAVLRDEQAANDLLYSGLSEEQQRIHDELVAAGVLPERGDGRAAS
ncbi:hypothetical protein WN71_013455 [Streptomyces mangrovisoli]|uniref:Uncharacterized protein n=1 Tax=Streptomyces mangrovisoli TaxID=1428628 RepID=A0A1J4NY32_9ACTN|nr:hypothetical protein WN71_013455 [Streptomyces mangrovisoli]